MRHVALIFLLSATACFNKFPAEDASGVFACDTDADCTHGFFCQHGKCVDPKLGPRCAEPVVTTNTTSATDIYVGFSLSASAVATSSDTECPLEGEIAWEVCDAPDGSAFKTADGSCKSVATGANVTFTPDIHGSYALTARAEAGDNSASSVITINAKADSLFVAMGYNDASLFPTLVRAQIGADCWPLSSSACSSDSKCAFDTTFQTCWTNCAPLAETDCNAKTQCTWTGSVCQSELSSATACVVRDTQETCSALPFCAYDTTTHLCLGSCSTLTTEAECGDSACAWDPTTSTCKSSPLQLFSESTVAELLSDGSDIEPLHYSGAATYRYDPNGVFTTPQIGNGLDPSVFGLAFNSSARLALVPHLYMFKDTSTATPQCGVAETLIFWEGGDGLGINSPRTRTVQDEANEIQHNTTTGTLGQVAEIGFPDFGVLASGATRFVYGSKLKAASTDPCTDASGNPTAELAYSVFPAITAAGAGPLSLPNAMPIVIGQADTTTAVRESLKARILCDDANECGGSIACTGGRCASDAQVEGYLPRFHAAGQVLTWSREKCGSQYGSACSGSSSPTLDLMMARISASAPPDVSFTLNAITTLSNDPAIDELDAFVPSSAYDGRGTAYFLGRTQSTATINVKDGSTSGTYTAKLPTFSLYKRTINWTTDHWDLGAAPTPVLSGKLSTTTVAAYPCPLGGQLNRQALTQAHASNVAQFTFSPDGRYLAYAITDQVSACGAVIANSADLKLDTVVGSKLQIIDLASLDKTPVDLIPASCTVDAVNVMPRFIANGQQVVFNSLPVGANPFQSRFYRMNVSDVGATTCPLVDLSASEISKAKLAKISPNYIPTGVALADSRTGLLSCTCGSVDGGIGFVAIAIGAMWRALRRRWLKG